MIITKSSLLDYLSAAQVSYTVYEHPPVFTAKEAGLYCANISGAHVKNLFLRNKKKTHYLLVTVADKKLVDLIALGESLQLGRLSFANHEELVARLGVQPGSVTPLAILNDEKDCVRLYIDKALLAHEYINVHPMENTVTLHLKASDLFAFIEIKCAKKIHWIDVPTNEEEIK